MQRPQQHIIFVTGKGGVGKTALSASIALLQAQRGRKVLLAELGETSFLQYLFPKAGETQPQLIQDHLWTVRWSALECLREYFLHHLKIEKLVDLFFHHSVAKIFLSAAPGLNELALLGKITSGPRGVGPDMPFDVVVVDAFATGHFKALLMAPVGMSSAIQVGPMAEQCQSMIDFLKQNQNLQVVTVATPEELPLKEAAELNTFLYEKFQIQPRLILNRTFSWPHVQTWPIQSWPQGLPPPLCYLDSFYQYLKAQAAREEQGRHSLPSSFLEIPFFFTSYWPQLLAQIQRHLAPLHLEASCRMG